MVQLIVDNFIY